ncbi:MAG: phosphoglycerate kinase [Candidatus Xenobia bacterium]
MNKATVRDVDVRNKRVLMRVDFNVPLKNGQVTDTTRLVAALPTVRYLLEQGAKVILMSHLGRPDGQVVESMRLAPVAAEFSKLLGKPVQTAPDCIGPEVEKQVDNLKPGEVLLLENLRFHPQEEKNDAEFSKQLARLGDVYVNDAFGTAHRAHASTVGVTQHLKPCVAGFLMGKECDHLGGLLANPPRPFVALLGGAKVRDKIGILRNLVEKVDEIIIGGGMAFTFLKLQGHDIGKSLLDQEMDAAKAVLERAEKRGVPVLLPVDVVVAPELKPDAPAQTVDVAHIPPDQMGLDIGPRTVELFRPTLEKAGTILWNGPMGVFEMAPFAKGTRGIADVVAHSKAVKVIGGGDSAAMVEQMGVASKMTHISTGGGASLEFLEGRELPGVAALAEQAGVKS